MMNTFDAIIIGAGQAGPSLAARLTQAGMTVALIERKLFGGTCVNTGCIPTKTLIASARAAHMARRAADYGVVLESSVRVDMGQVKARKDAVSGASRDEVEHWLREMKGCTIYQGHARFDSPQSVRIANEQLSAERVFINVGGRAIIPAMPGIDEVDYLTNSTILELDVLPRHLVIIGGSYIGLEFAQMYRRFGSEVTVIEKGERLIAHEDPDISDWVKRILADEGIQIRLKAECIGFTACDEDVAVNVNCTSGEPQVRGSHVLLAVGRRANTDDLDLENAGVDTNARGFIKVDEQLQSTAPNIWALGDCNGHSAFTHTAYNDFEIVAGNLLDNEQRKLGDRIQAYALYTDPPLGRAGMSEAAAQSSGRHALIGKRPMTRVGRAVEKGETQGLMKIIVDADTQKILGAAILGPGGDEAIHAILDMMYADASYPTLQRAMHIHPTVSELIPTLVGELEPIN